MKQVFMVLSPENVNIIVEMVRKIIRKEDGNPNFWHNQIASEFWDNVHVGKFDIDEVIQLPTLAGKNESVLEYTKSAGRWGNRKPLFDARYLLMNSTSDLKKMNDIIMRAHDTRDVGEIEKFFCDLPSKHMKVGEVMCMRNVRAARRMT